jgi:hypothetical protein
MGDPLPTARRRGLALSGDGGIVRQAPAGSGAFRQAPAAFGTRQPSSTLAMMTRDELLLTVLAEGDASTATLSRLTGLGERTCRYGLRHLIDEGYAWSPARGAYRLTRRGRAIAAELGPVSPAGAVEDAAATSAGSPRPLDVML